MSKIIEDLQIKLTEAKVTLRTVQCKFRKESYEFKMITETLKSIEDDHAKQNQRNGELPKRK